MCRHPRLWIAAGVAAVVVAFVALGARAALPLLFVAACPLMMLLMAGGMAGMPRRDRGAAERGDADEVARLRTEVTELRERVRG